MKNRTSFLNIFLKNAIILVVHLMFFSCKNTLPYQEVEDINLKVRIDNVLVKAESLNENECAIVKMDTLTKFNWDKMFIFCGNIESNEIDKSIGFPWEYSDGHELFNEGNIILIFVKKQQVVSSCVYIEGDHQFKSFRISGMAEGVFPANSIFYVDKQFDTYGNYALRFTHQKESNETLLGFVKKKTLVLLDK
jgi:hypothetical protein